MTDEYVIVEHTFKDFKTPKLTYVNCLNEAYELCKIKYNGILNSEKINLQNSELTEKEKINGRCLFASRENEIMVLLFLKEFY